MCSLESYHEGGCDSTPHIDNPERDIEEPVLTQKDAGCTVFSTITESGRGSGFGSRRHMMEFSEIDPVSITDSVFDHDLEPAHFLDRTIDVTHYPSKDYHRMYIGKIVACLVR
jgi:hypothetical protein